ncbi:MAG: hypothetical protein J0J10_09525 [Bosea sp.]|uniref:hypothetical protein n=1 Tax=Bosea sp. (in: a-proteobacteria) TaxID=1871050 RepID=UPI001AC36728|nr:hypothetical protein [Bosea sp. (in: a-proteobacteria)]MBN9468998.1 hypothetical protein [Bosea sp. (in: a-proteobacteria)]
MATPKELIASVAEHTGVPLATVIVHDRNLAEEGLRSPALRGRGVSRVTYQDAANLLIAVAASRNVKDSAKTVREYVDLMSHEPMFSGEEKRGRTFGDALAALLEAVPAARERFSGPEGDRITVALFGPKARARIDVMRQDEKPQRWDYEAEGESWPKRPAGKHPPIADLTFISEFTQITIGCVGELVAGEPERS